MRGIPPLEMGVFFDKNVNLKALDYVPYLPNHIRPLHYDLHIKKINVGKEFSGSVSIRVEFLHDADFMVLNIDGLNITDCLFSSSPSSYETFSVVPKI